jgi:hypothetical protein
MFKSLLAFTFGLFLGQEFGSVLPNVKNEGIILYNQILRSEFYKKLRNDFDNNNKK